MDERKSGKAEIEILSDGHASMKIPIWENPETKEEFRLLECDGYQIVINCTRLIELAEVPRLASATILSLEESRALVKHWGSDFDFTGQIFHKNGLGGKYKPFVVLNLAELIKEDVEKTRISVVETLGHEMRHAQQYQLSPEKGFPLFIGNCVEFFERLKTKSRFMVRLGEIAPTLFFLAIGFSVGSLPRTGAIVGIALLALIAIFYLLMSSNSLWRPIEKDARKFAQQIIKDRSWLECVEVTEKTKSSP